MNWPRAWAYLLTVLLLEACSLSLLAVLSPGTLNQRGTFHTGVQPFDRVFAALWLALSLCVGAVAGLDAVRFGWSRLPGGLFYVGVVALVLATGFGSWAMIENNYFEQFVQIQKERGHSVVTKGPYRIVRHPGYLGTIVGVLFVLRTHLEDSFLRRELPGYDDYSERTRFRLVPFIW